MAEIAIPLALLGGLFIASNKDSRPVPAGAGSGGGGGGGGAPVEGFTANRTLPKHAGDVPAMEPPAANYPVDHREGGIYDHAPTDIRETAAARYYQPGAAHAYMDANSGQAKTFTSLTGEVVNVADMKHNNMTPFFGSNSYGTHSESDARLDYMTGAGSTHIKKREQAPLFAPQAGMHNVNGAKSNTDFMMDRARGALTDKTTHGLPFEQIHVGPGIGKGYTAEGSGGFNSGLESRELWMDRTVDELRTKNNPKVSYAGVILGGKAPITERGKIGAVEKRLPDRFYESGPERYFTTTGAMKGPTSQAIPVGELRPEQMRQHPERFGGVSRAAEAGAGGTYVPKNFSEPFRLEGRDVSEHIANVSATGRVVNENEFGVQGYRDSVTTNNRTVSTNPQSEFGIMSSIVKAMVTPIMDALRPTRKQNAVGNIHGVAGASGAVGANGVMNSYVERTDRPRTTLKDLTVHRKDHMFVQPGDPTTRGAYTHTAVQVGAQQRDSTTVPSMGHMGGRAGATGQTMLYNAQYNAELIDKTPTLKGRKPMGGGVRMFNTAVNHTRGRDDAGGEVRHLRPAAKRVGLTPGLEQFGQVTTKVGTAPDVQAQRLAATNHAPLAGNPYSISITDRNSAALRR